MSITHSYLRFIEQDNGTKKTKLWNVVAASSGALLGTVEWYGPWRQYTLRSSFTIFNADCLDEVASFLRTQTAEHRRSPGSRKR